MSPSRLLIFAMLVLVPSAFSQAEPAINTSGNVPLNLEWMTCVGGAGRDDIISLAALETGEIAVTGNTSDLSWTHPTDASPTSPDNSYIAFLSPDGGLIRATAVHSMVRDIQASDAGIMAVAVSQPPMPEFVPHGDPDEIDLRPFQEWRNAQKGHVYEVAPDLGHRETLRVGGGHGAYLLSLSQAGDRRYVATGLSYGSWITGGTEARQLLYAPLGGLMLDFDVHFTTVRGSHLGLLDGFDSAVSAEGVRYVYGFTFSPTDVATRGAFQSRIGGERDVTLTAVDDEGNILWSTYFGGSEMEWPRNMALTREGLIVLCGHTQSKDLPVRNAFQDALNCGDEGPCFSDGFLATFSPDGELLWSTYLGGEGAEHSLSAAVDSHNRIWVVGNTASTLLPGNPPLRTNASDTDQRPFIYLFDADGNQIGLQVLSGMKNLRFQGVHYSEGSLYVYGASGPPDTGTLEPVNQHAGANDGFVMKFHIGED